MDTKNVVLRVQQRLLEDVGLKTNKQDAQLIYSAVCNAISDTLLDGEDVLMRGVCKFVHHMTRGGKYGFSDEIREPRDTVRCRMAPTIKMRLREKALGEDHGD